MSGCRQSEWEKSVCVCTVRMWNNRYIWGPRSP